MNKGRWQWWIAGALLVAFVWRFQSLTLYFLAAVALSFIGKPVVSWVAQNGIAKRPLGHNLGAAAPLMLMASSPVQVCSCSLPRWFKNKSQPSLGLDAAQLTNIGTKPSPWWMNGPQVWT